MRLGPSEYSKTQGRINILVNDPLPPAINGGLVAGIDVGRKVIESLIALACDINIACGGAVVG